MPSAFPQSLFDRWVVAALLAGGPLLAFPDAIPASARPAVVTIIVATAFGLVAVVAQRWSRTRWGLWIFLAAAMASWATMPSHDAVATRHFAGIGLGVLLMAVTTRWARTSERLVQSVVVFAVAALVLVGVGLAGTQVFPSKYVVGAEVVPQALYFWMPRLKLGMPGLSDNGFVNPNALGGTALMALPVCVALAVWAWGVRRKWLFALGALGTTLAVVALTVTLSRTAVLATLLTATVFGVWSRRGRRPVALALGIATLIVVAYALRLHATLSPDPLAVVWSSLEARTSIWSSAIATLAHHPWLGVGINAFHDVVPSAANTGITYVAHAHNTFLQVALDIGLLGLTGYVWLLGTLLSSASRTARGSGVSAAAAAGAGLSLIGLHWFGMADAIALGAKVGALLWISAGLILAATHLRDTESSAR